jgi:uncharacterized membrane protein YcaP (DUF421 family)
MCARAVVIYIVCLVYIRLAGKRAFGKLSAFDNIIAITLGAMLSRAIVGISPFFPILASSLLLVLLHRLVAWLSLNHKIGKIVKGESESLYKGGNFNTPNLRKNYISHHDLMEGVRTQLNENSLDNVDEVFIERNGRLTVAKKNEND